MHAVALMCGLWAAGMTAPEQLPKPAVSERAARAFAQRLWQTEPFIGSSQWRHEKRTLRYFFDDEVYRRLRGNDILGFWAVERGFSVKTDVALTSVKTHPLCRGIREPAWRAAFAVAGGSTAKADATVEIACLEAVYTQTVVSAPGALIEWKFTDAHGRRFFFRSAVGKQTLEAAMVASFDLALRLAKTVEAP